MKGIGVSSGIAIGCAVIAEKHEIEIPEYQSADCAAETEKFQTSLKAVTQETYDLREQVRVKMGEKQAQIIDAYIMIMEDPEVYGYTMSYLGEGWNVLKSVQSGYDDVIKIFEMMDDEYIRQRIDDIRDMKERILYHLLGKKPVDLSLLPENSIVVAHDLTTSDTAKLDVKHVRGFLTETGGVTSHTSIMARSLEIPAVVGAGDVLSAVKPGMVLAIDGTSGEITLEPSEEDARLLSEKVEKILEHKKLIACFKERKAQTADGCDKDVFANIGSPKDLEKALQYGCEGIGLFRSEFLYLERETLPSEEEQFSAYKAVLAGMQGKPVIVRTLDVGGDKRLPALALPHEENPFLGYRAIRICLSMLDLFKTQLRALLRASTYGNLQIMFPMISSLGELREAKAVLKEVREDLKREGIPFCETVKVGMMIEIPSAALLAHKLAKECDFFSVGTNDLVQYTVAVDRGNERISSLYTHYHPSVLRLISYTIQCAHQNGIPCGMCGEAAADVRLLPALVAMGLDEFSASASSILDVKYTLSKLNQKKLSAIRDVLLDFSTAEEVKTFLDQLAVKI